MRVLTGIAAETNPFVVPTDAQLDRLFATVIRKHPVLEPSRAGWSERQKYERTVAFKNAFHAVAYLGRRSAPENKNAHALSFWVDHCETWCREENVGDGDLGLAPVTIAILAHGDIPFLPLDRWPLDLSFGLQIGGRRATDKWRRVLDSGQLLAPTPAPRSHNYPTPPVRIMVGE